MVVPVLKKRSPTLFHPICLIHKQTCTLTIHTEKSQAEIRILETPYCTLHIDLLCDN